MIFRMLFFSFWSLLDGSFVKVLTRGEKEKKIIFLNSSLPIYPDYIRLARDLTDY